MRRITVGHSPDSDDAFMFFALATGLVKIDGPDASQYEEVHDDIQSLNLRAHRGELAMSQISAGAYPSVADRYRVTSCGSSMGLNYGPAVVAPAAAAPESLRGARLAVPGEQTTAYLLARLYLPPFKTVVLPFDTVMEAVSSGEVDAAIVIHEGQLTFGDFGLHKLMDLGQAWQRDTGLPLPLGINVVRRDLEPDWQAALAAALRRSIEHAHAHPERALAYARSFARGLDAERSAAFTRMYVNALTLDMGEQGVVALRTLFERGRAAGLIDQEPPLDVLRVL